MAKNFKGTFTQRKKIHHRTKLIKSEFGVWGCVVLA